MAEPKRLAALAWEIRKYGPSQHRPEAKSRHAGTNNPAPKYPGDLKPTGPKNSQVKIAKRGRVDTDPIMAWGPGIKMVLMRPKAKAET